MTKLTGWQILAASLLSLVISMVDDLTLGRQITIFTFILCGMGIWNNLKDKTGDNS